MPDPGTHSLDSSMLPNFDDKLRAIFDAVVATEAELTRCLDHNEKVSPVIKKERSAKFEKALQDFKKLAETINEHYKAVKGSLATSSASEIKAKQEKKHAVAKAKEYRARITALEQKAGDRGASQEETAHWYTQERKRRRVDEDNSFPAKRPAIDAEASQTLNTRLSMQMQLARNALGSSRSGSSTKPSTNTPIPKSKKTDFTKQIPSQFRANFVSTRLMRPNVLVASHSSSHILAILQGLCASMKAHEAWKDISARDKFPQHFIDYIARIQHPYKGQLDASSIEGMLKGIENPIKYLQHTLHKLRSPYIENAYQVRCDYSITCRTCAANGEVERTHEKSWTLALHTPQLTKTETFYKGLPSRDLIGLIQEKLMASSRTGCPGTGGNTCSSSDARKIWLGFACASENIVFSFDQTIRFKVQLPLEHDFKNVVRATGEKTKYRLITVVKKMKDGTFTAYVHTEDGKWWRTTDGSVEEVKIEDWQGGRGGDTILAFYEQLE